ncbi:protein regulator of cytokinesis 1-like isoform X2 [Apostichopus japonicus]|uniref:protein regulator of cytokinesis 1-like isoform X2 n=1 Tax=Stichopus japonicus TaxID=307972 RepID=UPI003AB25D81
MAEKRRQSMKLEVSRCLDSALNDLILIWNEIGIEENQRDDRQNVVLLHLQNLLDEMVREEKEMKKKLLASVEICGQEVVKLSAELRVARFEPEEDLSILQVEKVLRQRVDALKREKKERMDRLETLQKTEQLLCDILSTTPMYIPTGTVPTDEQLKLLQEHIETLRADKQQREDTFRIAKRNILDLMDLLEQEPNTSFERDVICEEEETFSLSMENMDALKRLQEELEVKDRDNAKLAADITEEIESIWNRLQFTDGEASKPITMSGHKPSDLEVLQSELSKLQELKKANLKKVIDATREEIFIWWDKCFYSREQRNAFAAAYNDEYTEELLQQHDEELVKVKNYHEANKTLLESVKRREEMWKQMLEFEKKATDPNRFNNRGCVLLQEEKMRAKLNKDLPKLEKVLGDKIEQWEGQNGTPFLVDGVRFVDYVEAQWAAHEQHKKIVKEQRVNARSKETEHEMRWGSKPTTPNKRRFPGTPNRTPKRMKGRPPKSPAIARNPSMRHLKVSCSSRVITHSKDRDKAKTDHKPNLPNSPIIPSSTNASDCTNLQLSVHIPFPSPADKLKITRQRKTLKATPKKLRQTPSRNSRRKVLGEKNSELSFSTTMSSNSWKPGRNTSISSVGSSCPSYTDFSRHLDSENRQYCLSSSVVTSPQRSHSRVTGM